jgi:hypothetical protein
MMHSHALSPPLTCSLRTVVRPLQVDPLPGRPDNEWVLEVHHPLTTDADGWSYANDCSGFHRRQGKFMAASSVQGMTDYVRQRHFVRKRPIAPDSVQSSAEPIPPRAGHAIGQPLIPDFVFVKDGRTAAEDDAADQIEADAVASSGAPLLQRHCLT